MLSTFKAFELCSNNYHSQLLSSPVPLILPRLGRCRYHPLPPPKMSNRSKDSGSSSSSGARGRIATVLAQARASLKDPTRPYTPQSLDQRTSIQSTSAELNMLNAKYASFNSSQLSNNTAYSSFNTTESTTPKASVSKTHNILNENLRKNFNSSSGSSYAASDNGTRKESMRSSSRDYEFENDEFSTNNTNNKNNNNKGSVKSSPKAEAAARVGVTSGSGSGADNEQYMSFKLLLTDINDMLLSLEFESMGLAMDIPTSASKLEEILNNLTSPISKLSKFISKDKTSLVKSAKADIDVVGSALAMALFRVNDNEVWNIQLKQLLCRHVLRFYISCLSRNKKEAARAHTSKKDTSNSSKRETKTSPALVLCSDVSNTLKRVTECLYQTRLVSTGIGVCRLFPSEYIYSYHFPFFWFCIKKPLFPVSNHLILKNRLPSQQ